MGGPGEGGDVNPLKSDSELKALLLKLDKVKKYKTFQNWKKKFLDRLSVFLYENGIDPAEKATKDFDNHLKRFVKGADKVTNFISSGDIGPNKQSVKARLAFREMCNGLSAVVKELNTLIPGTGAEEKKKGFTKFHLGAALIRQGFHQYGTMKGIEDALEVIGGILGDVADRQDHELFAQYKVQLQRFCDVMADLGLYEVMMKCLEFAEEPAEPESDDEEDIKIEISVDTPDGVKVIRLELDPNETIGNVKEAISGDCGIDAPQQVLTFKGRELKDNGATLKGEGIGNGAKLKVDSFKIPVTVNTHDGKTIKVMVDPKMYLSDLKRKLEPESEIPAKNQRLSMNGTELDDDFQTAEDCGIKAGSVLDLEPKSISVTVEMPDGTKHEIKVRPSDTTEDIKNKIADKTGMEAPRQALTHNGKAMPDGARVKDMGIKNGSNIKVDVFKVPVTVKTHDGKTIETMVDPTMYLSDLKRQLEPESGVPAINQRLSMNGKELGDDGRKAGDYGIKGGSVLELEPKSIKISVEMPDGTKHDVDISPKDNSDGIKKKIEAKTGMPVEKQVLKLNGRELPNGKTAGEMGIKDGTPIKVDVYTVPVTVNTHDGRTIKAMVDPTAPLSELKRQLEDESGVPASNQRLLMNDKELGDDNKRAGDYGIKGGSVLDLEPKSITVSVEMPDGSKHAVEISPSDTDAGIKDKIEKQTGMAAPRQVVKFKGKELPKGKKAKEIGIQDGSPLKVEVYKVPVTVNTMDGKKIKVMVDPTDKLRAIKKSLEGETGLPPDNQKLFMNGNELDDDNKTAQDYGIKGGSELDLEPKSMDVFVDMPDGSTVKVPISPLDTSDQIKKKIEAKTGLEAPRQVLKFNGRELPNGKGAKAMGIEDGSPLRVEIKKVPVTVRTMDGNKIKIMVDPTDTLAAVKKTLEGETGIAPDNQKLSMEGRELVGDNKSADAHGIRGGSELDLEPRSIKLNVEMPDGSTVEVAVKPRDNAEAIKKKIADQTGLAAPRQVLKHLGKTLPANKSVKDMGLKDGAPIKCEIYKIPISVRTEDGKNIELKIEPTGTIDDIKKMLVSPSGIELKKQVLKNENGDELKEGRRTAQDSGIKAHAVLSLEKYVDAIVFIDVKAGTLFGLDRDSVVEQKVLTPLTSNMDFAEATKDTAAHEKIKKAMLGSTKLGFATQVVVEKLEVEDYDLQEAEKVKAVWGVALKKQEKNKKGEEFIFVDAKTGACGELSRKKYINNGFITPTQSKRGEDLKEAEKDTQKYDKYIRQIREVFGVTSAK